MSKNKHYYYIIIPSTNSEDKKLETDNNVSKFNINPVHTLNGHCLVHVGVYHDLDSNRYHTVAVQTTDCILMNSSYLTE